MLFELVASRGQLVANTTITRRQNALALFQAYAEKALASGAPPKGLEQTFAATLQISPSMWSQIKSSRPIGDKLARQIEALCAQPAGWLDEARTPHAPSAAEQAFIDLALAAWRASHAAGKRALRQSLKAALKQPAHPPPAAAPPAPVAAPASPSRAPAAAPRSTPRG